MNKRILTFLLFSLCFLLVYPEEIVSDEKNENTEEDVLLLDETKEKKEIIRYGLELDVVNLIKELKEKEDDRFSEDLVEAFFKAKTPTLKIAILDFFSNRHLPLLNDFVLQMLENLDDYKVSEINALLYYIGENQVKEAIPHILSIMENERFEFIENAINTLGKIGGQEQALALVEFYQNVTVDDDKKEVILKEAIMRALENIAFSECLDFLFGVIEDENENVMVRSLAVSALSKIQNQDVFDKLVSLYSSSEPLIRVSSIRAISKFDSEDAKKLILEACKDAQYKVRLEAIKAINFSSNEVTEYLLYRAKSDPEMSIKTLSIEKLVPLNSELANDWLLKTFNDDNASLSIRLKIAKEFLENRLELIIKDVERVAIKAVSSDKEKKLAYELGKVIAKIKTDSTYKIAEYYIKSKDVMMKTLGLDMFSLNKYSSIRHLVEDIKNDSKAGALQKRAVLLLSEGE